MRLVDTLHQSAQQRGQGKHEQRSCTGRDGQEDKEVHAREDLFQQRLHDAGHVVGESHRGKPKAHHDGNNLWRCQFGDHGQANGREAEFAKGVKDVHADQLGRAIEANQRPIMTETIFGGANLVIMDKPMGERQSSPKV